MLGVSSLKSEDQVSSRRSGVSSRGLQISFLRGGPPSLAAPCIPTLQGDQKSIKNHQNFNSIFNGVFNGFWVPFSLQVGAKFDPKSQKVCLKSAFEKTIEKYHRWNKKSLLPKSKNIAKPLEGCSKSHFSQIRDEIEKMTLGPLILERFLEPKSSQDPKKSFRNRSKNSFNFWQVFLSILAPFWTLRATLKFDIFEVFWLLLSVLGHLGAKMVPEVLQGSSGGRFFKNFYHFWVDFSRNF